MSGWRTKKRKQLTDEDRALKVIGRGLDVPVRGVHVDGFTGVHANGSFRKKHFIPERQKRADSEFYVRTGLHPYSSSSEFTKSVKNFRGFIDSLCGPGKERY